MNLSNNSIILYKSMISNDLRENILNYYWINSDIVVDGGSLYFPKRRVLKDLPLELIQNLNKELIMTNSQYYDKFIPNTNHIRIYHSNYGIVKRHQDKPTNLFDTHTCLIYLTDDFYGGKLSIENSFNNEILTLEPKVSHGVIFPKEFFHYNDELLGGDKIILILDCKINQLDCEINQLDGEINFN